MEARCVLSKVDHGVTTPDRLSGGSHATMTRVSRPAIGAVPSQAQVASDRFRDIHAVIFASSSGDKP